MTMTLSQATEIAKQASPLPHVAHEAMQVLVAELAECFRHASGYDAGNAAKADQALHAMDAVVDLRRSSDSYVKDAARYSWLRSQPKNPWPINSPDMIRLFIVERGPTLDAVVDKALARVEGAP